MKIALISDTHDNFFLFEKVLKQLNERKISLLLHAGDLVSPPILRLVNSVFEGKMHFVFGNNEGEKLTLAKISLESEKLECHNQEAELEIDGRKIYMIHYSSIGEKIARLQEYDLVVSGHDHKHRVLSFGKTTFINPGNLTADKKGEKTYVVLDLEGFGVEKVVVEGQEEHSFNLS